ncbi:MAG: right-handed parallel beta-helix repeat-containing protein [bacterium]
MPVDAATIQAGIDSALAGDVVEIACGTYYEHDLLMKSGISLRSESGTPDCVTIDAQYFSRVMRGHALAKDTVISGITFRNGGAELAGGGIYCDYSSPLIENCEFRNHQVGNRSGAAICWDHGSVRILGCGFFDNDSVSNGGAIFCSSCDDVLISGCYFGNNYAEASGAVELTICGAGQVEGCVFFDNETFSPSSFGSSVLSTSATPLAISRCTFADNIGHNDGVGVIFCGDAPLSIERCIIAENIGKPITISSGTFLIECCDFYGNSGGDWVDSYTAWTGIHGNFSANPCFCDLLAGDLELAADSYCLSGNHPWGCDDLVGALPAGCAAVGCSGPVATEARSWGMVKSLYR